MTVQSLDGWKLKTFLYTEYERHDFEQHIDPDNNVFNGITDNCNYYSDEQLNMKTSEERQKFVYKH